MNNRTKPTVGGRLCEACNSAEATVLLDAQTHRYNLGSGCEEWNYRLLECRSCRLGFIDPLPTWQILQTFYDNRYGSYDRSLCEPRIEAQSIKYDIARLRLATVCRKNLPNLLRAAVGMGAEITTGKTVSYTLGLPLQLSKNARILDVGYGSGNWLLTMAQLGYNNLFGYDIEANTDNVGQLRAAGIQVSSGQFLENEYPLGVFDCIRMEHVFEHLLAPIAVLAKCHTLLRDGRFLVMTFPFKDSWSTTLSLMNSPLLQLPKHLYHHTRTSAELMLRAAGFVRPTIRAVSVVSTLESTVNTVRRQQHNKPLPASLFTAAGPIYSVFGKLTGRGDFLTIYARK